MSIVVNRPVKAFVALASVANGQSLRRPDNTTGESGPVAILTESVATGELLPVHFRLLQAENTSDTSTTSVPSPAVHIIEPGETFEFLAGKYNITVAAIQDANPGVDPNQLSVGDLIVLPGASPRDVLEYFQSSSTTSTTTTTTKMAAVAGDVPMKYSIQTGDTFETIETNYSLPSGSLEALNPGVSK